jgi:hypothetical protein
VFHTQGPLHGKWNQYLIPGGLYSAPAKIEAHGYDSEIYVDPRTPGWDGQFYYYMANDPLALADTEKHMDMPAYRYQRIGVPLVAYIVSKITGRDWVSPTLYFAVTLLLMTAAAYSLASYAASLGYSPYWALVWSTGGSALFTIAFGFVDGASDALLIIALIEHLKGRRWAYAIAMTFAVLGREVYALFPAAIAGATGIGITVAAWRDRSGMAAWARQAMHTAITHAIPIAAILAWQAYLGWRFAHIPPIPAAQFLGMPFAAIIEYILTSATGNPISTYAGFHITLVPYSQAIGLSLFLALNVGAFIFSAVKIMRWKKTPLNSAGIFLACCALSALYICFRHVMLWEHVGYVKAASMVWAAFFLGCLGSKSKSTMLIGTISAGMTAFSIWAVVMHTTAL